MQIKLTGRRIHGSKENIYHHISREVNKKWSWKKNIYLKKIGKEL